MTRIELARHVEAAFASGPATRDSLLAHAARSHARPAVIAIIRDLPDKTYASVTDIWPHLTNVPADRQR